MTIIPELDCYRCHNVVKPIKALTNYCCPSCGATIVASRVEQALAKAAIIDPPPPLIT